MVSFDKYLWMARIFPAIIATAPVIALVAMVIPWATFTVSQSIATVGLGVLLFFMSDIVRRRGKNLEQRLYETSGKPSTRMLRYTDVTFSEESKADYRTFLGTKINKPVPTRQDEIENPAKADALYERFIDFLRENTRDHAKFPVLFHENVTYGFRRNLYAARMPGLILNAAVIALAVFYYYDPYEINFTGDFEHTFKFLVVIALVHASFLLFFATHKAMVEASHSYARQLILSCETLMNQT